MHGPRASTSPSAAIFNSTPLFETQDRSIWLVTPIDSSWPAERQESQLRDHNWVFLRTIAMHETYPGHHLQPVHAKRQPSAILRGNRSTLMSEGWGLYTEDVFWEVGFLADPRQRHNRGRAGLAERHARRAEPMRGDNEIQSGQ